MNNCEFGCTISFSGHGAFNSSIVDNLDVDDLAMQGARASAVLVLMKLSWVITLRPEKNGHHFAGNILKLIFWHENHFILFKFH